MTSRLNGTVLRVVLVAALGGTLLGFDTAVVSGATHALQSLFALSPAMLGVTVSSALWGTVVGAMAAGRIGQRFGGRTTLLCLAGCYVISAIGCSLSTNWWTFVVFRFIGGLGMGGSSVIAPVYIAEVSPAHLRGRLVGTFQINIICGILLAYLSNYIIGLIELGAAEWRWQMGIAAAPALVFLALLFGNPPSARWLASRGRIQEAWGALLNLGNDDPRSELERIVAGLSADEGLKADRLFQWRYRRPILLAVLLALFNQLIGINAVLYYLNDIFAMAGFDRASQNLQAVAVGCVMLVATLTALTLIDRFGRKTLLVCGSIGLALCLAGMSGVFIFHRDQQYLLALVMGYVGFFCFSQGAVIWVYLSEIFPSRVRSEGQALGCSVHWIMNALISAAFPAIAAMSHAAPFVVFLAIVIIQLVVVIAMFPETKGIGLEELEQRIVQARAIP